MSTRTRSVLAGAVAVVLVTAMSYVGVSAANGAFADTYDVIAVFDAAGQGLLPESDVKIHGVDVGEVRSIRLAAGRAVVTMKIDDDERIPVASVATIRPKTLFGEKFVDVDPGQSEVGGPFLGDGDRIAETVGAFELERVLADLHPILQAVDGDQVAVILGELAASGRGMGETINRAIANLTAVADVQARRAGETQQLLDDLALLSEELSARSSDLVAGAADLNAALPPLNERDEQLAILLEQAARLSADLADVLEANTSFTDKAITKGGRALSTLDAQRHQLPGLIRGLRVFVQVLAEVGRIDLGDGTKLAAIKGILGGGSECGRTSAGCPTYGGPPAGAAAARALPGGDTDLVAGTPGAGTPLSPLPVPLRGADALVSLVEGLLR